MPGGRFVVVLCRDVAQRPSLQAMRTTARRGRCRKVASARNIRVGRWLLRKGRRTNARRAGVDAPRVAAIGDGIASIVASQL